MSSNGPLPNSDNFTISDRELLFVVNDHQFGDNDRRLQVGEMIETLNLRHENARQSISTRLGYMGRIGLVSKDGPDGRWRLTDDGQDFIQGRLSDDDQRAIARLHHNPGKLLDAVGRIGMNARKQENSALGHGLRRQWKHSTGRN